jgi:predicted CopG family antitoxin
VNKWLDDNRDTHLLFLEEVWDTIKLKGIQLEDMGLAMADRKNLKIDEDTFERLSEEKREDETWDGYFRRLLDQPEQETMIRDAIREELRRFAKERGNDE